jgi:hypothetical protein
LASITTGLNAICLRHQIGHQGTTRPQKGGKAFVLCQQTQSAIKTKPPSHLHHFTLQQIVSHHWNIL